MARGAGAMGGGDGKKWLSTWLLERPYEIRSVVWWVFLIGFPISMVTAQEPVEENVFTIQLFVTQTLKKCEQAQQCLKEFAFHKA